MIQNYNPITEEIEKYIFIKPWQMATLPPATYIGKDTWLGTDGIYYVVDDFEE